ncbi:MAG TPA: O-antigen ligase family protein [Terriglobales bacterium]|nr:O-antigen ligase family protein [Terriglobales bacterium]
MAEANGCLGCVSGLNHESRVRRSRSALPFAMFTIPLLTPPLALFHVLGVSLAGWLSVVAFCWASLYAVPSLERGVEPDLWPILLFFGWVMTTLFIHVPSSEGVQNVVAMGTFVALTTIACRRPFSSAAFAERLLQTWARIGIATGLLYLGAIFAEGPGADATIFALGARAFAIFALFANGCFLAKWKAGSRRALAGALFNYALIAASLSRMAFVVGTLQLLVVAIGSVPKRARFLYGAAMMGFALVCLLGAVFYFRPFAARMAGAGELLRALVSPTPDALLSENGIMSGRAVFWLTTWLSYKRSPWIGLGAGSAGQAMVRDFGSQIGHPHSDFLRVLHDFGAIGLMLFLAGVFGIFRGLWRRLRVAAPGVRLTLLQAAVLSFGAVVLTMLTDNTLVYVYVMAPLGVVLGVALSEPCRGVARKVRGFSGRRAGARLGTAGFALRQVR